MAIYGTTKQTGACSGTKALCPLQDIRSPLRLELHSHVLARAPSAWALHQDPGPARVSGRPLLLVEPQGWVTGSVRMRRSSPAWPSSWAFTTACCPGGCHRALSLPRVLSALQARGPSKLPRPPCPREWASAQAPWKLPSLESGLGVEAWLLLRTWPGLGLTCEALGGTPWLWGWLTLPSPKGAGVTHVSHGGEGSGTAASREWWASPPGQSNWAAPMEALGSSRSQQPSWLP